MRKCGATKHSDMSKVCQFAKGVSDSYDLRGRSGYSPAKVNWMSAQDTEKCWNWLRDQLHKREGTRTLLGSGGGSL